MTVPTERLHVVGQGSTVVDIIVRVVYVVIVAGTVAVVLSVRVTVAESVSVVVWVFVMVADSVSVTETE